MTLTQVQWQRVGQYVRSYLARTAATHGGNAEYRAAERWMHTLNVLKNLELILDGEEASPESREVCQVAALFHDVDHFTVELQYHALRGAETAQAFLLREGHPEDFARRVAEAVRGHHHDFDDLIPIAEQMGEITASLSHEARMVMDAETLDKIGASNILQSIITLGRTQNPLTHDTARELISGWPLERARQWQATLVTPTGKIMGAQRLAFYEQFLKQVAAEIVIHDPFRQPSTLTQESMQLP
jgi:HD superfamily phosphodiesterase